MKPNLEDSGNSSPSDDDEVTNEFENLIARATELITASSATSYNKVKDTSTTMNSMLEAALENDFIMG